MKLAIFGATGITGGLVVTEATQSSHSCGIRPDCRFKIHVSQSGAVIR
jgi:putative NADH-flavin reductase